MNEDQTGSYDVISFEGQKAISRKAQEGIAKLKATGIKDEDSELDEMVQFVCPTQPNSRFLVKPGIPVNAPFQRDNNGIQPVVSRDGDVWAEFASGILTTDDADVIEWCLAHSGDKEDHESYHKERGMKNPRNCGTPYGLCRLEGPGVGVWAKLAELSMSTATHDVQIPPEIDINSLVKNVKQGDASESMSNDLRSRAAANMDAAIRRRNGE